MAINNSTQTIIPPPVTDKDFPPEIVTSTNATTVIDVGGQNTTETNSISVESTNKSIVIAGITNTATELAEANELRIYNTDRDIYFTGVDRRTLQQSISVNDPGGLDTQVQFNDGGQFGGVPELTYNKVTNTLTTENLIIDDTTYFSAVDKVYIPGGTNTVNSYSLTSTSGLLTNTSISVSINTCTCSSDTTGMI